ncbi:unnamed protein product [Schistosoma margrebowiei]|uniref:Uncharacterized protein n=1 Tax=Schistosoma margrebowiei TaxID=48269 RepID=A0A183MF51_9TREM|nr:unnamed protein product [Schistosoma margrebowiei]
MKTSKSEGKHGTQLTAWMQPHDSNFADDLILLSHVHEQIEMNATTVTAACAAVGLNIHKGKSMTLNYNTKNTNPVTLHGEALEDVESFTYLESIINGQGGSDADINARIGEGRMEFLQLENIWNPKQRTTNVKMRIFNTNVKTILLYGAETWRTITIIIKKVRVFINSCLLKILNMR